MEVGEALPGRYKAREYFGWTRGPARTCPGLPCASSGAIGKGGGDERRAWVPAGGHGGARRAVTEGSAEGARRGQACLPCPALQLATGLGDRVTPGALPAWVAWSTPVQRLSARPPTGSPGVRMMVPSPARGGTKKGGEPVGLGVGVQVAAVPGAARAEAACDPVQVDTDTDPSPQWRHRNCVANLNLPGELDSSVTFENVAATRWDSEARNSTR